MNHYRIKHWVLLFILGFSVVSAYTAIQPQPAMNTVAVSAPLSVIVDAGHGGFDGGATGYGLVEADINLAIAKSFSDLLTICGAEVSQTRTTDIALSSDNSSGSNAKTEDIHKRLALFSSDPNALVVSVHQNFYTDSKYSGAQMFYGLLNPESMALAECFQQRFYQLQPDNTRQIAPGPTSVYLLQHTENPMVLAECGFLSNFEEAMALSQPTYQTQVAFTLLCGVADYSSGDVEKDPEKERDDESEEQF